MELDGANWVKSIRGIARRLFFLFFFFLEFLRLSSNKQFPGNRAVTKPGAPLEAAREIGNARRGKARRSGIQDCACA